LPTLFGLVLLLVPVLVAASTVPTGEAAAIAPGVNGLIAFRHDVNNSSANIYTMEPDGSDLTQLTHSAWNDQADWSPDGTKIVYTQENAYNGDQSEIMVMNADGSDQTALTQLADQDSVPSWSPNGTEIAFRRDQSGTKQIWLMNADGSDQRDITPAGFDGISPVWSPDGQWICYVAGGAGNGLWAMHPDGSGNHQIYGSGAEPTWSPDGTQIAFTANGGGIWLVNSNGSDAHQLTNDTNFDLEASWAPDGTKLVFDMGTQTPQGPDEHLGVINRDGTGEEDLTPNLDNSGIEPSWQPVPAGQSGSPPAANRDGYWLTGGDGGVYAFGAAHFYGSTGGLHLNQPVVGLTATPDGLGYWFCARDGGVFAYGDARDLGSLPALGEQEDDVIGLAADPGGGYWLAGADGTTWAFGGAPSLPSLASLGVQVSDVVGVAATPDGLGLYLVARDGGIFALGDARFWGSMGGRPLNEPIVGMAVDPTTGGYWEVAADGGIFAFGAPFDGSTGNLHLVQPIVGMTATSDGLGYWFVAADGGIFAEGDAPFSGSLPSLDVAPNQPITAMASL